MADQTPPFDVEVFATGNWLGRPWTTAHLDEMVTNFDRLRDVIKPPLKLGHDDQQMLAQQDGQPALGWLSGLRRVGTKLVATLADVPTLVRDLLKTRRYDRVSAEIYPHWEDTTAESTLGTGVTGMVMSALALLGADVPEVKTLDDLHRVLATELGTEKLTVAFAPASNTLAVAYGASPPPPFPRYHASDPTEDAMDEATLTKLKEELQAGWTAELETKTTAIRAEVAAQFAETATAKDAEIAKLREQNDRLAARHDAAEARARQAEARDEIARRSRKDNYRLFPSQQGAARLLWERLGTDVLFTAADAAERAFFGEKETPRDLTARELLRQLLDGYPPANALFQDHAQVAPREETLEGVMAAIATREKLSLSDHAQRVRVMEIVASEKPDLVPTYGRAARQS